MARIKDLTRWVFKRIKKIGDGVEFKVILEALYIKRLWSRATTIRIVVYNRGQSKRVGVVIRQNKPDLIEFKEFLSLNGAINYIESKFPQSSYVYYYRKPKHNTGARNAGSVN